MGKNISKIVCNSSHLKKRQLKMFKEFLLGSRVIGTRITLLSETVKTQAHNIKNNVFHILGFVQDRTVMN